VSNESTGDSLAVDSDGIEDGNTTFLSSAVGFPDGHRIYCTGGPFAAMVQKCLARQTFHYNNPPSRTRHLNLFIYRVSVIVFVFTVSFTTRLTAEEWTNLRGTSTVVGKLIGIWNGRAILRLEDGRQLLVKLDDLKSDSRIQAEELQVDIDKQVKARVQEMDSIALEAASPAPPTLPTPKSAPTYQPPSDSAELSIALEQLQAQALAGHLRVYFDSLPKAHQEQADEWMKLGLQKFDPGSWESVRAILHRLAEVAVTKQRWLFSHPKFASIGDAERDSWLTIAAAFRQLGTSENASFDKLQASPIADTVGKFDDIMAPYLYQILSENSAVASLVFPTYQVESGPDGVVMAKVVLPFVGTVQSYPMVQIEGRWVEGKTVEEAAAKWASYKTSLDAIPNGSIRLSSETDAVLDSLSALVAKLEQAKNRGAFHRAIDAAAPELGTSIASWAGVKSQPGMSGGNTMSMEMNMNMGMGMGSDSGRSQNEMRAAEELNRAAQGSGRGSPSGPPSR